MRRLLVAALCAAAACGRSLPVIESFEVDTDHPPGGGQVRLTFSVRDAALIRIVPEPGEVMASPVVVTPYGATTYTLRASNDAGSVTRDLLVQPPKIGSADVRFSVLPSQALPGTARTVSWSIRSGGAVTLSGGGIAPAPVASSGQMTVTPTATTVSTLSEPGFDGPLARAVARVVQPTAISSFAASPS